jgi:hypothetical protein
MRVVSSRTLVGCFFENLPVGLRPRLRGGTACFLKTMCLDQRKTKLRTVDFSPLVEFSENSKRWFRIGRRQNQASSCMGGGGGD